MIREFENFIKNEYKGVIITICLLIFFLFISIIWYFISGTACNLENTLELSNKFACEHSGTIFNLILTFASLLFLIGSIGTIYGLYKLFKTIYNYLK